MRTKSNYFLNLATLCLALFGAILLMAQPANAEEVSPNIGVEGTSQYYGEMQGEYDEEAELSSKDREFGRQNVKKMAKRVKMDLAQQ
ncbi:TPA: hypothetical protein VDG30_001559 [Streptococcus pyogenes]|uniref:hypothetical protein n=1 Tax=Streptococcus pyogenes TaxID=1314 RepID=UPI000745E949|nr:hypothetical protein [Streptococcus pyogenes]HER4526313.1 hypothetical protein [Streptococcus pyogenes NGAS758]HER4529627.1 hypothetical protein [Streptococcus pyogenes NGAS746]HER4531421.1 hypothetical protein [Streptococcus pyogenes NGAS759]HER4534597.1 hypothetical protein [Streptococcus pyogenes NGAS737]HER4646962.1 hypothetical protein [Streptococcus pyogenes NGAS493]HER4763764.1 hypothetical protein [Streptococcus pyogenes NGAS228]